MPQNRTRCWYFWGTMKYAMINAQTKTLSMLRLFSMR